MRPCPTEPWRDARHSSGESAAVVFRQNRRCPRRVKVREGKLDAGAVSILYVQPAGRNGAEILRLRIDGAGEFVDEWPDGFFEDSYREMFPVQS